MCHVRYRKNNRLLWASYTKIYDLDWDLQLNEAIKIIEKGGFANLVKNTKTLKQLQEEAEANMAKDSESK